METIAKRDSKGQHWVFLDEINTCDHLGLLTELICHHTILGKPLVENIVILAACNPYKRREKKAVNVGLEGKIRDDELSTLVYRVHPLPEALMDYVWDYGSLSPDDELMYIRAIVSDLLPFVDSEMIVQLISNSQKYIRDQESPESVSMRDVKRCKTLMHWFRKNLRITAQSELNKPVRGKAETQYQAKVANILSDDLRAIILALSHCYHSRLGTTEQRKNYRIEMANIFHQYKHLISEGKFIGVLQAEQLAYVKSMERPAGTALNSALLENVFILLVCILNKIPVFLVGKPGCSKSLSMQLIYSNLRGQDSKDGFLKKMPQVFVIAFQGSESSTSDGVLKVFEKAQKYLERNEGVIPVVLLDEVGLAEISKANPLKVLHGLIEPAWGKEQLDVAVVGISNWALDAAKMNRAIHLYRPEPDADDLHKTGMEIQRAFEGERSQSKPILRQLANAYHKHHESQLHKNFHGLRDYYSLVKYISRSGNFAVDHLIKALERNFGGLLAKEMDKMLDIFTKALGQLNKTIVRTPVLDLIKANLEDPDARHLMIISSGDAAIGILEQYLKQHNLQPVIIYGSKFSEDQSEQYIYRILSQIILCMETGRCMVLKDLEDVYGSLYDMLNQNYTEVGKKRNCRIALGAYSNPMCYVHENFRCIVLTDHNKINYSNPPFLNRFEKQMIMYEDVLGNEYQKVLESLMQWARDVSCHQDFEQVDMFTGFHEDTLSSVVLLHSSSGLAPNDVLEKCKQDLIMIASVDAIVRAASSPLAACSSVEVDRLVSNYFSSKVHNSLPDFVQVASVKHQEFGDPKGIKTVVMTHSSIHVNVASLVGPLCAEQKVQVHKVGAFTSEKQLSGRIQAFFGDNSKHVLILQCSSIHDAAHILLAKSAVDQQRYEYKSDILKHVLIVIHLHRGLTSSTNERWQLNFQCGWKQICIDTLETADLPVVDILEGSVVGLFAKGVISLEQCIIQAIDWAFTCIKYPESTKSLMEYITDLKNQIKESTSLMPLLKERILGWIRLHEDSRWQATVASDKKNLLQHSSLREALLFYIQTKVNTPLAMLIFVAEKLNALWTYFHSSPQESLQPWWYKLFQDQRFVNIDSIMEPKGSECYIGLKSMYKLRFPFSLCFIQQLEVYRNFFTSETIRLEKDENNIDPNTDKLSHDALSQQEARMREVATLTEHEGLFNEHFDLFLDDFLTVKLSSFGLVSKLQQGKTFLKAMMKKKMEFHQPVDIFVCWWRHEELLLTAMQLVFNVENLDEITDKFQNEDHLVQTLCESMIPLGDKVSSYGGVDKWQKQLNIILSKLPALNIKLPPTVPLLRMCNDFVNIVLRSLPATYLASTKAVEDLQVIAKALTSELPGTEAWFNNVLSIASGLLKGEQLQSQFVCAFISRALVISEDEHYAAILDMALEVIAKDAGLVAQSSLVISILIRDVEETGLLDVLSARDLDGCHFNVEALNQALLNAEAHYKEIDNIFAVLCCDVMQRTLKVPTITSDSLDMFACAIQIMLDKKPQPILIVIAAAFVKQFAKALAKVMSGDELEDIPAAILQSINAQLNQSSGRVEAVKIYVLKELGADRSLFDVRNTCAKFVETFPWLTFQWLPDHSPVPFDIFRTYVHYNEFSAALTNAIVRTNMGDIEELLARCQKDPSYSKALLGCTANFFYFTHASRPLNTSEQKFVDWLASHSATTELPAAVQKLLFLQISNFKVTNGMLVLKSTSPPNIVSLTSVITHFLIELATTQSLAVTPFYNYVFSATDISSSYLPGEPNSEGEVVMRTLKSNDMQLSTRCICGYVYIINCGATDLNAAVCQNPQCRQPLAGLETISSPFTQSTPQFIAKPGLVQEQLNPSPTAFVRNMTPAQYRMLHLLTHLSFFLHFELQSSETTPEQAKLKRQFQSTVVHDWVLLPTVLNQTSKGVCGVFHSVFLRLAQTLKRFSVQGPLSTAEARDVWENDFNNSLTGPILQNPDKAIDGLTDFVINYNKDKDTKGLIEREVQEKVEGMNAEYKTNFLPRILRITAEQTREDLCTRLTNDRNLCEQYPFLVLFFKMESKIGLVKHLFPIVEWVNIVMNRLSHRIDRQAAQTGKIEEFIALNPSILAEPFNRFTAAWSSIRKSVKRFRCNEFKYPLPEITLQSPISLCCAQAKDEGLYICGALEYLKDLQNMFLEEVINIAANGCRSLLYIQGGLRSCPIYELKASDVVSYEWSDEILQYSQLNLEYGKGKEVVYNFAKIELELAHNLVSGKAVIDMENMVEFEFHRELFHGFSTILQDIRSKVPQEKLSNEKISTLKNDSRVVEKASQILQALDFIMTFLKKTGAQPTQSILQYCKYWKLDPATLAHFSTVIDVEMQYLVSLYEEVEDMIASKVVEAVDAAYTEDIPIERRDDLQKLSENLSLEALMITFRRFIFRYISVAKIKSSIPLSDHLATILLCWPLDVQKSEEIESYLNPSLKIAHVYQIYAFLRDKADAQNKKQIQILESTAISATTGSSSAQPPRARTTAQVTKRKVSQKFNSM